MLLATKEIEAPKMHRPAPLSKAAKRKKAKQHEASLRKLAMAMAKSKKDAKGKKKGKNRMANLVDEAMASQSSSSDASMDHTDATDTEA
eukprot:CAMPEP_0175867412 /NCGR_PEP_ID=MMETSP0107_2-20121207/34796_1 /TAXON_ID=195067 ORGANISM="Goniomonas pacifica, Strain CCMP1869" /NCGR_SAMPLE_ID=MMETSP0107_2 /ASSEMBLY_ACC=CAM_ASM_000203 /LENGTH=88 /DNA_ID=CAMNT_0017185139 /DNA_START=15 /DNA_END=278 /DNA_ORIENTATION=+